MKHAIKLTAILASLTLLTGCGAFNTSEQTAEYNAPITDAPATVPADSDSEEVADCCGDSLDCCSDSDSDCCEKKSETAAPEKAELNLGYLNSTAHLLAFVAAEEGYFAEEGLNVTLTQFSSAGELVNGLDLYPVGRQDQVALSDARFFSGAASLGSFFPWAYNHVSLSPSAVLVIREGVTKVVNIKEQNYVTKIVDMVPDVVDRFSAAIRGKSMMSDEEAAGIAFPDETQKDS